MKTLLILRHAKSDWNADHGSDHDRPLNQRGLEAARQVGLTVVELDLVPDLVLSSTATRARLTAELAIEEGGWETQFVLEPDLYHTGVDGVLEVIAVSPDVDRVMVVGHQPTWGSLVYTLTGVPTEMKTATLAVVELPISNWSEVRNASGKLVEVRHPR